MDIFSYYDGNNYKSIKGLVTQVNRNDYCNTYAAKIMLPDDGIFADLNYMAFTSSLLSQSDRDNIVPSQNGIVFCDKTRQSITALNITFPNSTMYYQQG